MEKGKIRENYERVIDEIFNQCLKQAEYEVHKEKIIRDLFVKELLKKFVPKINSDLKVLYDRIFAISLSQTIRKSVRAFQKTRKLKEFDRFLTFIKIIADLSREKKLILQKQLKKVIQQIETIRSQRSYRLQLTFDRLKDSDDLEEFRQDFFNIISQEGVESEQKAGECYRIFYEWAFTSMDRRLLVKTDMLINKFEKEKEQLLGTEFCEKIQEFFKGEIGGDDFEIEINQKLKLLAIEESLDSNFEHKQKIEELYQYIKFVFNKFSGMKIFKSELKTNLVLCKFGSNVSGFASKNTDMDLTILTNCYIDEKSFLKIIHEFFVSQFHEKFNHGEQKNLYKIELRDGARIPLIKITFLKYKGIEIHFDIIINNILGVINSKFLSIYGSVEWIRQLGILIKMWGKSKDLISQWRFSSYSFNVLMLHFLIETGRVNLLMDARTRQPSAPHFRYKRMLKDTLEEFDVYYQFNIENVTKLKRINLYEILHEFFCYYKADGAHWKLNEEDRIITLDGSKMKEYDPEYIFTVKDPFDEKHNPGRVKVADINNVMQSFENAARVLRSKDLESIITLFEKKQILDI